jgi:hypothetical protein
VRRVELQSRERRTMGAVIFVFPLSKVLRGGGELLVVF